MTMPFACPACSAPTLLRSLHGGLFLDRCTACGWEASGTCNPAIDDMPAAPARRIRVRWPTGAVTPHALSVLRALSPTAKGMGLVELSQVLAGGQAFDLGAIPAHAHADIQRQLAQAGFVVEQEAPR